MMRKTTNKSEFVRKHAGASARDVVQVEPYRKPPFTERVVDFVHRIVLTQQQLKRTREAELAKAAAAFIDIAEGEDDRDHLAYLSAYRALRRAVRQ